MNIIEDIIRALEEFRDQQCQGKASKAAKSLGISEPTFSRWLSGQHRPKLETLLPAIEQLGARIYIPGTLMSGVDIDTANLLKKVDKLEADLAESERERIKQEGKIELLKEQLHDALQTNASGKLPSFSGHDEIEKTIKAV